MSFVRPSTFWGPLTPTVMEDTKWPQIQWTGLHKGQCTNMSQKTGTFFGTLMALDGVLAKKNIWPLAAIGTEVWKKATKKFQGQKFKIFEILGGLDTSEPWQGRWNGGVLVECVGRAEPPAQSEGFFRTKEDQKRPKNLILDYSVPHFTFLSKNYGHSSTIL